MRILRAAGRRRIAWKNGGGQAEDIATEPPDASWEAMDWRVSRAWITASGPFSIFPGIDRTFVVVEGGVELSPAGMAPARLTPSSPPYGFPGDVATGCRLSGGDAVAFNVMTARGRWRHRVTCRPWSGIAAFEGAADLTLVTLLHGLAGLAGFEERAGEDLRPLDAVWLPKGSDVRLAAGTGTGTALAAIVELWAERPAS